MFQLASYANFVAAEENKTHRRFTRQNKIRAYGHKHFFKLRELHFTTFKLRCRTVMFVFFTRSEEKFKQTVE